MVAHSNVFVIKMPLIYENVVRHYIIHNQVDQVPETLFVEMKHFLAIEGNKKSLIITVSD